MNSGSCRVSLGNAYPYGTTLGIWPPSQLACDAAQCGATQNTCDSGQYLAYNESLGQWACLTAGPNNAGNVVVCMPPAVSGRCNTPTLACSSGNDNAPTGPYLAYPCCLDGTYQYTSSADAIDGLATYSCLGEPGGTDSVCWTWSPPPRFEVVGPLNDFGSITYYRINADCRADELGGQQVSPEGCSFSWSNSQEGVTCYVTTSNTPYTVNTNTINGISISGSSTAVGSVSVRCEWSG